MEPSEFLQPIAGPNPAGENLRYEPIYDEIKVARTEEPDVPQGDWQRERKTAEWPLVIKLATDVLKNRSKDLQIAAWLTEALTRHEGYGGLRVGIEIIHGFITDFWDSAYPELEDGDSEMRAAPLEWLGNYFDDKFNQTSVAYSLMLVPLNRAGHDLVRYRESRKVGYENDAKGDRDRMAARQQDLDDGKLSPEEFDDSFDETPKPFYKQLVADLDGAATAIDTLEKLSDEKFGEYAPSFSRIRDGLKDVRHVAGQLLAKKLEQDPDPPSLEPEPEPVGVATGADAPDGGLPVTPRSPEDATNRVAAIAKYLRSIAPTNPAPYLMLRGLRWGELRVQGNVIDPLVLSAPPTDVRTRLKTLLLKSEWEHLLEMGEDVMATAFGRGWLDLQRYVLTACGELGGEYDHVSAAIRGALRSLLRDLPQLPELTLMDDSPTANAETRGWLRDQGLLDAGDEPDLPDAPAARPLPRTGRDAYDRAMERVRAGEPDRAIDLLMREASQEKSERAKFLRRSQAASIMVEAGLENVATPILREMLEQIDRHALEEWESGDTVAQPLGLLYRCMLALDEDESTRDDLYLRVCRLDPLQAIKFRSTSTAQDEQPEP